MPYKDWSSHLFAQVPLSNKIFGDPLPLFFIQKTGYAFFPSKKLFRFRDLATKGWNFSSDFSIDVTRQKVLKYFTLMIFINTSDILLELTQF